jgi:probable lipoprotein (TIGR04455 family)
MNRLVLVLGLALLSGCATVKSSHIRPDYETVDKTQVKRLVVVTQPLPDGKPKVGELWSLVARRYVNQNRDFIARSNIAVDGNPEDTSFKGLCVENLEGILWLTPDVKRTGKGLETSVKARLIRCRDGQEVWGAEAAGSWPSEDERYKELIAQYTSELGDEVSPYVAPTFRLLSATLDTLPRPQLTDADVEEKIELGE